LFIFGAPAPGVCWPVEGIAKGALKRRQIEIMPGRLRLDGRSAIGRYFDTVS